MLNRLREVWANLEEPDDPFIGEVEVDETYIGGKEGNKHAKDKLNAGRGTVGKIRLPVPELVTVVSVLN